MIETLDSLIASINEERHQHELDLIEQQIQAGSKMLEKLSNQNENLQKINSNLDFNIEELQLEKEELMTSTVDEHPEEEEINVESSFFSYLSTLENQENMIKTTINANTQRIKDLSHEKAIKLKEISTINNKLAKNIESIEVLDKVSDENESLILNLQAKNDATINQIYDLIETTSKLQRELELKTTKLEQTSAPKIDAIRKQKADLETLLEQRQRELNDLNKTLIDIERETETNQVKHKQLIEKMNSINSWKNDRDVIIGKVKQARQKFAAAQKNLEGSRRRNDLLVKKLKQILGNNDSGEGDSIYAKKIVQAEIEESLNSITTPYDEEVDIELEYSDELDCQLNILNKSIKQFKEHHKMELISLNAELEQADDESFLNMLKDELKIITSRMAAF